MTLITPGHKDFYINTGALPPDQHIKPKGFDNRVRVGDPGGAGEMRWDWEAKLLPRDMARYAEGNVGKPCFFRGHYEEPDQWILGRTLELIGGGEFRGTLQPIYRVEGKSYPWTCRPEELIKFI